MIELDHEQDMKQKILKTNLHWYKIKDSWIITRHDRPQKNLTEIDPPECSCLLTIASVLLLIGGDKVSLYRKEIHVENLNYVLRGTLMTNKKIKMRKGRLSMCHQNVSRIWMANPKKYRIVSGFAVDGTINMWIAHSWLLDKDSCVVETISPFALYFGVILNDLEAKEFANRHINNNKGD